MDQQVQQRWHLAPALELGTVGDGRIEQAQQQGEAVVVRLQAAFKALDQ